MHSEWAMLVPVLLGSSSVSLSRTRAALSRTVSLLHTDWKLDTVSTARNLDLPLLVIHTPCDLIHVSRSRDLFASMSEEPLRAMVEELNSTEQFRLNPHHEVVLHGDPEAKPGKVYNPVGAGWRPLVPLLELACQAGIDTAVLVEVPQEHLDVAARYGVNVLGVPANPNCNYGINRWTAGLVMGWVLLVGWSDAAQFTDTFSASPGAMDRQPFVWDQFNAYRGAGSVCPQWMAQSSSACRTRRVPSRD